MIAGKGSTLVILNKGMNDTIRIIKSPENSCVLTHGVNETEKKKKKKERKRKKNQETGLLGTLLGTLEASVVVYNMVVLENFYPVIFFDYRYYSQTELKHFEL